MNPLPAKSAFEFLAADKEVGKERKLLHSIRTCDVLTFLLKIIMK